MANPAASQSNGTVIAGQYVIDGSRPLPPVGGSAAFAVIDQLTGRNDLMAVRVQRQFPPRPRPLQLLPSASIDGLLAPVAYGSSPAPGAAEEACYMICLAPPGPSLLGRPRPWPEPELLECVLRPVAHVLEHLQLRGLTHRGIRLDNVFQSRPGQPVVLGTAWAAPPAMAQPALFEPPYSAMCLPAGRGDGSIADDVYSLGVLLLCLSLGRGAMPQLDDAAILHRKLEQGTYAALAGDETTAADHRRPGARHVGRGPGTPADTDLAARSGQCARASPCRAGRRDERNARSRSQAARSGTRARWRMQWRSNPEQALHALRAGTVVAWLRRGLGDALLAAHLEELVRHRTLDALPDDSNGDATLVMRAIALLDPLAPLCWRGMALWPDGIGTALAAAQGIRPRRRLRGSRQVIAVRRGWQLGCGARGTVRFRRVARRGSAAARVVAATRGQSGGR